MGRSLTLKKRSGLRPEVDEHGKGLLETDFKEQPVAGLLQQWGFLQRGAGVHVNDSTIFPAIKRLEWSLKRIVHCLL